MGNDDVDDEIARLEAELAGEGGGGGGGGSGSGGSGGDDDGDMKAMLANWTNDDSSSDDSDESSEEERREIDLDDNTLDHIVLAAPDLEAALDEFEEKTSIKPKIGGAIKGLGLKTARISFEGASYIEIIAPDPDSPGPIGNLLESSGVKGLRPFHYAIRNGRCEKMKDEVAKMGYTPDHISMFGAKEDGTPRKWEMLYLYGHKLGGIAPFIINWANSDHPCETLPVVGRLKYCRVSAPEDDPVHKLVGQYNPKVIELEKGEKKFEFAFSSPEGTLTFESKKMVGFRFPGFEEECGPIEGEDDEEIKMKPVVKHDDEEPKPAEPKPKKKKEKKEKKEKKKKEKKKK